jgi:Zn-dependent protease with chaperone function
METFPQAIEDWHDFYMMVGTAAATLIGLLFVSLSLNADIVIRKENADLRALATHTFGSFMSVLMFAVLFLIPRQVPAGLGLPLLGIGGYGLYNTVCHFLEARHKPAYTRKISRGITLRFGVPILCFGTLLIIAVFVLFGGTSILYWLVPVMILLIVSASRNAWDLLLRLRESQLDH